MPIYGRHFSQGAIHMIETKEIMSGKLSQEGFLNADMMNP